MVRLLVCLQIIIWCMACTGVVDAQAFDDREDKRVTIMSIPSLTFEQLRDTAHPQFRYLFDHGAVGAMNLRTAGSDTLTNSYATIAAGRRVSVPKATSFHQVDESYKDRPVSEIVYERTGQRVSNGAVYPNIVPFVRANAVGDIVIPMLSDVLHQAGLKSAVWGNADLGEKKQRFAPFLTMNMNGFSQIAEIDDHALTSAAGRPYGVKTDYAYMIEQLRQSQARLRVVELGDLYRLEHEREMISEERQKVLEETILQEIDRFIEQLRMTLSTEDALLLMSPYTDSGSSHQKELAPIIWYEPDGSSGLLFSPTTRRTGILANIDLSPTIIQHFELTVPRLMVGQPIVKSTGDTDALWRTLDQVVAVYQLRSSVIYTYALFQVTTLLVALWLLLNKRHRQTETLQIALLAIVLTPVLFLLLAAMPIQSYWFFALVIMGCALSAAFLLKRLPTVPLFFALGLIGFIPVIADGLLGGQLIRRSFLGYDPIIGARYYGIGNEYMGVVLGSVILLVAAGFEWKRPKTLWVKVGTALLFLLLVLYFAAPFMGTNAGGAIAASVGFSVAFVRFNQRRWTTRTWVVLAVISLTGLASLFMMNVWFNVGAPSHIGRAFDLLLSGDFAEIIDIASRKLATNVRLIKGSLWGRVFFTSLLAMTVLIIQPMRGVRWLETRYPYLYHGFTAILVASVSALVVNDSGIVSAATAIVYVVVPLLIIICRDWKTDDDPTSSLLSVR